jgi:predicted DNA binding CopG/RHH family protein
MQRVNVHLSEQQLAALKSLSEKTGLAYAELIRRAIDRFLEASRATKQVKGKKR